MAQLDGINLGTDRADIVAGAALRLSKASRLSYRWTDANNAEVFLQIAKPFVVVMLPQADRDTVLATAFDTAQQALDVVAAQGLDDLTTPGAHEGDLDWWKQDGRVTLRWHVVSPISFGMTATLTVGGPAGSAQAGASLPRHEWHEAIRYFRFSQTTNDLYDSYRNMYLAFESLLSTIEAPQQRRSGSFEPDRGWIRRAYSNPKLTDLIDAAVGPGSLDPPEAFYQDLYAAHRCALFHAKATSASILPGSYGTRVRVTQALQRLSRIVLVLLDRLHGISRQGGAMTPYAFQRYGTASGRGLKIAVTENDADPTNPIDYQRTTVFSDLATRPLGPSPTSDYELLFQGHTSVAAMHSPIVQAMVTYSESLPGIQSHGVVEHLDLSGVDEFEVTYVLALKNRGLCKSRFDL